MRPGALLNGSWVVTTCISLYTTRQQVVVGTVCILIARMRIRAQSRRWLFSKLYWNYGWQKI